jgi:hypothetical protein
VKSVVSYPYIPSPPTTPLPRMKIYLLIAMKYNRGRRIGDY